MNLLCINAQFSREQLSLFARFKITLPREGEVYTQREFLRTRHGDAYLLVEIVNPKIPSEIKDAEGGEFYYEPSWGTFRFRVLNDSELVEQEQELELSV